MITSFASSITTQPWFIIVALLGVFGLIVIAVILVKKYSKHFRSEEKPKSDKEIAEEEVNRLLVDVEEEKTAKGMEEAAEAIEKSAKAERAPSEEEVALEEIKRSTESIEDDEARKAMEAYAKSHPEEAKEALKGMEKKE